MLLGEVVDILFRGKVVTSCFDEDFGNSVKGIDSLESFLNESGGQHFEEEVDFKVVEQQHIVFVEELFKG